MEKVFGKKGEFFPIKEDASRIVIGYGFEAVDKNNATWYEVYLPKKQLSQLTLQVVKDAILNDINERVREQIIGGFVWNENPVWLSEENQLNFGQAVVPVTLKIGEDSEGKAVFETFTTQAQLKSFFNSCMAWKQQCLQEGWNEKDNFDWSPYEEYFPEEEPVEE